MELATVVISDESVKAWCESDSTLIDPNSVRRCDKMQRFRSVTDDRFSMRWPDPPPVFRGSRIELPISSEFHGADQERPPSLWQTVLREALLKRSPRRCRRTI